jgi:formylglycine-generating enzyme required for sulfatase activity
MVLLTGGSFDGAAGKVNVDSFCMDKTEVTVKAYVACVGDKKCTPAATTGNWPAAGADEQAAYNQSCNGAKVDKLNHPANCVDAMQAQTFCQAQDKLLPTETQWEWAARGKSERWPYPWGKNAPDNHLCWSAYSKRMGTCGVGEYPNGDDPWGVEDLDGNVREWLRASPGEKGRELCGADWTDKRDTFHTLGFCSTAAPTAKSGFIGFRCVKQ